MSAQKLLNTMRMWANMATQGLAYTSLGAVNAFDPSTYQVQVLLQAPTEDAPAFTTGWIPLASPWVGNGWGMFAPASPGDLILVFYQDASLQNPIAGMRLFFDEQRPLPVDAGEFWLVHQTGSTLKFNNDGTVDLSSNDTLRLAAVNEIDLTAPTVNITASTACNITSPAINAGVSGGTFEPLLNVLMQPTVNLKAT